MQQTRLFFISLISLALITVFGGSVPETRAAVDTFPCGSYTTCHVGQTCCPGRGQCTAGHCNIGGDYCAWGSCGNTGCQSDYECRPACGGSCDDGNPDTCDRCNLYYGCQNVLRGTASWCPGSGGGGGGGGTQPTPTPGGGGGGTQPTSTPRPKPVCTAPNTTLTINGTTPQTSYQASQVEATFSSVKGWVNGSIDWIKYKVDSNSWQTYAPPPTTSCQKTRYVCDPSATYTHHGWLGSTSQRSCSNYCQGKGPSNNQPRQVCERSGWVSNCYYECWRQQAYTAQCPADNSEVSTSTTVSGYGSHILKYYAKDTCGATEGQHSFNFTLSAPCTPPSAPGNLRYDVVGCASSGNNTPVTFSWDAADGADNYQIRIDNDANFGNGLIPNGDQTLVGHNNTSYTTNLSSGSYYFQVRSLKDCGAQSDWVVY